VIGLGPINHRHLLSCWGSFGSTGCHSQPCVQNCLGSLNQTSDRSLNACRLSSHLPRRYLSRYSIYPVWFIILCIHPRINILGLLVSEYRRKRFPPTLSGPRATGGLFLYFQSDMEKRDLGCVWRQEK
jgi:hypothetical protein